MEKNRTFHSLDRLWIKLLFVMRLTIFLFFAFVVGVQAKSYSQTANLTLNLSKTKLVDVLNEIEKQSDYYFYYNVNLDNYMVGPIVVENKDVKDVLDVMLNELGLTYEVVDRYVVIKQAEGGNKTVVQSSQQQQKSVSGKVTDLTGATLPGVSVVIKGTTTGVITNMDGNYSLSKVPENATLVFSFVGMKTQEIKATGKNTLNVTLAEETIGIEEVVAIGFGTQKRKDITGSVASVKGEVLSEMPVPTLEQSLSGKAAGVQVINGSGVPGAGATIRVRGVGTLNNNEPLYVIDGIILGNIAGGDQNSVSPLSMINPNDIESIDILKDASATAIYGARAGNGVVIITTKRGSGGKMNITYEAFSAVNQLDENKFNMMSGPEWALYYDQNMKNSGYGTYIGQTFVNRILANENIPTYDWIGELIRNGKINSHNLSVSGGNEKSNYFSSLSYYNQDGVLYNSDLERFTMRFNSDHKIGKFKFGNTFLVSRSVSNRQGNIDPNDNVNDYINRALRTNIYKPIYREDGTYAGLNSHPADAGTLIDKDNMHVVWDLKEKTKLNSSNHLWASAYMDYEIINGLVFHTMGSVDFNYAKNENYSPSNNIEGTMLVTPDLSRMTFSQTESRTWFIENTLTYNKTFFDAHSITAMAGYQAQNYLMTNFAANDGSFVDTDYWFFNRPHLQNADGLPLFTVSAGNGQAETAFVAYFGRFIYDYKGKYLLTATVRRDGSSKFGSNKRWGTFPALSGGWRISEESFMPSLPWLSNLKLRVGYGISGSDNVSNYQFASGVGFGGQFDYSFNGGIMEGATLNRLANTVLRWEEIKMSNIGLDVGLWGGKVNIIADYYDKITSDMFLPYTPAYELGLESNPNGNLGEVNNKGIDLSINTVNFKGDFTWTTDFIFGTVKNEIIKLPENADRFVGQNISRVGEEIGALYGYVKDGLFQNWDEVYSHAYQNQAVTGFDAITKLPIYNTGARDATTGRSFTAPGDIRFKDMNGDGRIDATNDRQIIGSTIPDFTWGLTNTFSYKGFSLSLFFQGVQGVDMYNGLRTITERNTGAEGNKSKELLNAWNGEGTNNNIPRILMIETNNNLRNSTHLVEDASYVRLKNLRVAYDLPQKVIGRIGMSRCQLYATGTNLLTFTGYSGYDPEIGLRSGGDNETAGTDWGTYPITKQYTLGVKVTF